jgi:hypothetical protein
MVRVWIAQARAHPASNSRYDRSVQIVTAFVPRDPPTCWRAFTDARRLTSWVPGLTRAAILNTTRGLAAEVHFEFATAHAYTLVYGYDTAAHEVRWEPKLGAADGVSGFARFESVDGGTRITYGLERGEARSADEQQLDQPEALVAAFVAFVQR